MDAIVDPDDETRPGLRDWKTWFAEYDNPDSSMAQRLVVVQRGIRRALDEAPAGSIKILSLCAGEGRDLVPVLAEHPRRADVRARLIEFDPAIAQIARDAVTAADLDGVVEVGTGDAADPALFGDYAPADLLLLCGIFGNITEADIQNTVTRAANLTARGGTAIWTRHRWDPAVIPRIQGWFTAAGFSDLWESDSELPTSVYVAGNRQERDPAPLPDDKKLFTFVK
ncbi:class I SAM-dependent methyltransferase family protein [Catenulispora rubra]|uniref:class I SAM-dependent methyltransferase family protein n=1 Tax=Catenulispora rubra TaxID=280293 RepID=UPI001892113D|nr:class I SAM-dependent methyltransferase family protein [Catenulispora rubra]